ncbi:MAG: type II toxin-antitoxin system VapC family toxin [archaeon]|nr:type II toxin-antitoxin system VapC family toxin [archaeon]MCP8319624.1 type II toxin-antitoxin system VapC family toxin [archaeon]
MISLYLDSSAFIKNFSEEAGSSYIGKIFDACEEGKIIVITSQWTIGESLAAIDRKFRRKEIDEREREISMIKVLDSTIQLARIGKLKIVPVREEQVRASWRFIGKHHLSADDALHLLSSIISLTEIFVAADNLLLKAAKSEGFNTYNIEKEDEAKGIIEKFKLSKD